MLARSFKTATELSISEIEHDALIKTLFAFERGEITESNFDMCRFHNSCETPSCICGWAYHLSNGLAFFDVIMSLGSRRLPSNLRELFDIMPGLQSSYKIGDWIYYPRDADVIQGANALRNYLTTGNAMWSEVLA